MRYGEYKQHINENVYQNASTGYVLTPSELAYEMVSTLPDSVFESDSTTFLDPICKSGTFLFEIVERLYDKGHSVSNIQSRIFTIDSNSHSLNIAKSVIRRILNKESGSFTFNTKIDFVEKYYNRLITLVSKGEFKTFSDFLNIILLDKNDKNIMVLIKNNISDFISQYEKVSKLESKLFGEVFTPRQLIDEMLDTLPEDVWRNPDLKWLDPAVGIGNFPAAILDRLMVGLESVIGDETERKKHILEEMFYFCDISIKNLFLLYMLFDKNNEFNLNVYRGSFLEDVFDKHMKEVWGLEGFDVVIGNPPYQSGEDRQEQGNRMKSYKQPLWPLFIKKGIDILKNDGFQVLITPTSWLSGSYDIRKGRVYIIENFKEGNLEYLNLHSEIKDKYFKNINSSFGYFTFKKSNDYKSTKIKTNFDEYYIDITPIKMVPRDFNPLAISINNKTIFSNLDKFEISSVSCEYNKSDRSDVFTEKHNIKGYAIGDNKSPIFAYYDKIDRYYGVNKVIIPKGGADKFKPYVDDEGLVISNNQNWIIKLESDFDKNKVIKFFNSKLLRFLVQNNRYSGFVSTTIAKNIPKVDLSLDWIDELLYKHFKLTQDEIDLIEKTIK